MGSEKDSERKLDNAAVEVLDNRDLESFMRGFKIVALPEKSAIRNIFNIDKIRIYDRSLSMIARAGDDAFAYELTRLMDEGKLKTRDEMMNILEKRGVWSEQHERRIIELSDALDTAIANRDQYAEEYESLKEDDPERKITAAVLKKESDAVMEFIDILNELTATQINFFKDTIEFRARTVQKVAWIVNAVCRDKDGELYDAKDRLWTDVEAFTNDSRIRNRDIAWLGGEADKFWALANEENERFFDELDDEQTSDLSGTQQNT